MQQLLRTVLFLHGHGIVHGCIQLGHLRITGAHKLYLLAHVLPLTLFALSSPYALDARQLAAPEVQRHECITSGSDVWSMGVVLLQLLTNSETKFCTEDLVDMDLLSPWLSACGPATKSFLVQCFKKDAGVRPTLIELMAHTFLTGSHTDYDMSLGNEADAHEKEDTTESEKEEEEEEEEDDL
ncbi:protein kinase [Strigomonas culicis]|uniref:Protein kinase n=1 Tax=Strigomonas culicis TaxID=28005 RepID=S9UBN5_9TRYP|nr:protein kinase [Strigomonas culicis]|eukprot:EPY28202.1 protein kinase [Strigomonas culicis]